TTLEGLLKAGEELLEEDVVALGVSCGGPLNSKTGLILSPPNLPGWDKVPIVKILEERFGRPAFLKNDADACAIAEWKWGNAVGHDSVIFLTCSTGMGAGLILNGKPYSGTCDLAGEVGHIRLYAEGTLGYGKRGSFEGHCSGGGMAQRGKGSAKELAIAARNGDKQAIDIYKRFGRDLGRGIAYLVDILNPEVIVIGSIFERARDLIEPYMYETLKQEALSLSLEALKIFPSKLSDSLGDKAAICVAVDGFN
ncbi:MAG: ROK family protein, partial [Clostridia bacterium]|nr:ROK family protein [Clostridia bacterium]